MNKPDKTSCGLHILIWHLYYVHNWDKLCWIFLIAVIFTFAGYMWRLSHEPNIKQSYFQQGEQAMIKEIAHEIPKGHTFHIGDVKFYPRKNGAVNISIAGAGDNTRQSR